MFSLYWRVFIHIIFFESIFIRPFLKEHIVPKLCTSNICIFIIIKVWCGFLSFWWMFVIFCLTWFSGLAVRMYNQGTVKSSYLPVSPVSRALSIFFLFCNKSHHVMPTNFLSSIIFILTWTDFLFFLWHLGSVKRPWKDVKSILNWLQTLCNWKDFQELMHLSMLTVARYVDFITSQDMLSPLPFALLHSINVDTFISLFFEVKMLWTSSTLGHNLFLSYLQKSYMFIQLGLEEPIFLGVHEHGLKGHIKLL